MKQNRYRTYHYVCQTVNENFLILLRSMFSQWNITKSEWLVRFPYMSITFNGGIRRAGVIISFQESIECRRK
jgi:hypothetical protein